MSCHCWHQNVLVIKSNSSPFHLISVRIRVLPSLPYCYHGTILLSRPGMTMLALCVQPIPYPFYIRRHVSGTSSTKSIMAFVILISNVCLPVGLFGYLKNGNAATERVLSHPFPTQFLKPSTDWWPDNLRPHDRIRKSPVLSPMILPGSLLGR